MSSDGGNGYYIRISLCFEESPLGYLTGFVNDLTRNFIQLNTDTLFFNTRYSFCNTDFTNNS